METFEKDIIKTSAGDLEITFIGHGSLMFKYGGKIIHIDPYSQVADYSKLPKADLILLAHDHPDHYDPVAFDAVRTKGTVVVLYGKLRAKSGRWCRHEEWRCPDDYGY